MSKLYANKQQKGTLSKQQKKTLSGLTNNSAKMISKLKDRDIMLTMKENPKYVNKIKAWYISYSNLLGKDSSIANHPLTEYLHSLIHYVCKYEVEIIKVLKLRETGGDFDIRKILNNESSLKYLGCLPAWKLIQIHIEAHKFDEIVGKCFEPRYEPQSVNSEAEETSLVVTAFVDESIHPVAWDEYGNKGKAGSYSYIVCWGDLSDETEITDKNILTKGVDYAREIIHIDRITETAIGKILLTLAYDFEYSGQVHIYTDNLCAANQWVSVAKNSRLSKLFKSVEVRYIPREKNKIADRLGRTRMLLDMPINAYEEIIKNKIDTEALKKRVELVETEFDSVCRYVQYIRSRIFK